MIAISVLGAASSSLPECDGQRATCEQEERTQLRTLDGGASENTRSSDGLRPSRGCRENYT